MFLVCFRMKRSSKLDNQLNPPELFMLLDGKFVQQLQQVAETSVDFNS